MTGASRIERALPRILDDLGAGPSPDYADAILLEIGGIRQRPAWIFLGSWLPMASDARALVLGRRVEWRAIGLVALLLLALAAGVVLVGANQRRLPPVVGPAGNGLIAYNAGGDIFIGDPTTGRSTAIVVGPELDSGPLFSPDGTHVAFVRQRQLQASDGPGAYPVEGWDPTGTHDVVVVRADGTGLRVIQPEAGSALELAGWTPDSAWVLAYAGDFGGRGMDMAYDPEGQAEPRPAAEVLPVDFGLRSPTGDRVLRLDGAAGAATTALSVTRPDGTDRSLLVDVSRLGPAYDYIAWPTWSPDGSRVAFTAGAESGSPACDLWFECRTGRLFLIDADGSHLRAITPELDRPGSGRLEDAAWSPDGSRIAVDRPSSVDGRCCEVEVVDVTTGAVLSLDEAAMGYSGSDGADRRSWSPDGRSLLFADYNANRLVLVDVLTGGVTELPWRVGLLPSWQRVATN